jgi:XapX domain-containing protein
MNKTLIDLGLSLLTGVIAGAVFGWFKLPLPAPPTLAGILGIVGLFAGYGFIQWLR